MDLELYGYNTTDMTPDKCFIAELPHFSVPGRLKLRCFLVSYCRFEKVDVMSAPVGEVRSSQF